MRDKTHTEHIERWVQYIKKHPDEWRTIHTQFINSQFLNAYDCIERLRKQPNGKEKIRELYNIKNVKGYPKLFRNELKKKSNL